MMNSEYRELTQEELAALVAFAKAYGRAKKGRTWKDELSMIYWYNARIWTGPVPGMGNLLHGIRNKFGPTWLYDIFKLPKAPKAPKAPMPSLGGGDAPDEIGRQANAFRNTRHDDEEEEG